MRMGRVERKILAINDELIGIDREEYLVREELSFHQHLNDDTQRDAAVSGNAMDRDDAKGTAQDVARFEARLQKLAARRSSLESKRNALIARLT